MDCSGIQPAEGEEEMGADDEDIETGSGGPEGIGAFLQSGRAGGVGFWGRDVGPDPQDERYLRSLQKRVT